MREYQWLILLIRRQGGAYQAVERVRIEKTAKNLMERIVHWCKLASYDKSINGTYK